MKQSASKVAAFWYVCNLSPLWKGIKTAGIDWARSCFLSPSFQCSQAILLAIMRSWSRGVLWCNKISDVAHVSGKSQMMKVLMYYNIYYIYIYHISRNFQTSPILQFAIITVSIFHSLLHLAIKFPQGLWRSSLLRTLSVLPWFQVRGEGKEWNEEQHKTSNRHHVSRVQNQLSSQHWLKTSHPC